MIRRPGLILALLTGLNLLNYIDRFVLSAVLPRIKDEFGLLDSVSGTLGTIFLLGYFVTSPFFGTLADRGQRRILLALGVGVWSIATIGSGLARHVLPLELMRALVGVGEASYATIAPTIIDDLAPPEKKGRWLAIFFAATPVGAALGYVAGGLIEKGFGWRAAFFGTGGPGLLLATLCLFIAEPKRRMVATRAPVLAALRPLWRATLYRRAVLGFSAYTFALGALGFWAPTFMVRHYGLTLASANVIAGGATVVGGAVGTAIGGLWADAWTKRPGVAESTDARLRGQLRICAIGSVLAAPMMLVSLFTSSVSVGVGAFFVCELALFICTSPVNAVVLQSVPVEIRASAMAVSIFAIHALGDLWSPPLIGALADQFSLTWAMLLIPLAVALSGRIWWSSLLPHEVRPAAA